MGRSTSLQPPGRIPSLCISFRRHEAVHPPERWRGIRRRVGHDQFQSNGVHLSPGGNALWSKQRGDREDICVGLEDRRPGKGAAARVFMLH